MTTTEILKIVRPLKAIALCALVIAVILQIVCLATTNWLKAGDFRSGLFIECTVGSIKGPQPQGPPQAPQLGSCQPTRFRGKAYFQATAALLIIACLITAIAAIMTVLGLTSSYLNRKYLFYRIAVYLALIAVLFESAALIVFPVCFYAELKDWGLPHWDFDWSYGLSWGVTIFTIGAALLLFCDREEQEVYYKENTVTYTSRSRI